MSGSAPRTHPSVRGFDRAAEVYDRSRPGYPVPAIRYVGRLAALGAGRTIVELGSGTGKLTRSLRPLGAAIVAVEPTAGMRDVFARSVPGVAAVDGTAEAIPLPDAFADAIVGGQAFHWFRPAPAGREIARVLRPGGWVVALFNARSESEPWARRLRTIFDRYRGTTPTYRDPAWRRVIERPGAPFSRLRLRSFRHVQWLDRAGVVDRVLSVSMVAALPVAERRAVAREVRSVLDADPATRGRSRIPLVYRTDVFSSRRRPG